MYNIARSQISTILLESQKALCIFTVVLQTRVWTQILPKNSYIISYKDLLKQVLATAGILSKKTAFYFDAPPGSGLALKGQKMAAPQLFKVKDLNFESLGIGGLDAQFSEIFRRAFQSRVLSPEIAEKLGVPHVKGMLLHGPPGTGNLSKMAIL